VSANLGASISDLAVETMGRRPRSSLRVCECGQSQRADEEGRGLEAQSGDFENRRLLVRSQFNVRGMAAQFEVDLIQVQTRLAVTISKTAGVFCGRKAPRRQGGASYICTAQMPTTSAIAELFGGAPSTVCQAVVRASGTANEGCGGLGLDYFSERSSESSLEAPASTIRRTRGATPRTPL
jgi:hypothetical protein